MDSFSGHLTSNVKDALGECNIDLCVIPGGCTKYLDISVNRSRLKDAYQLDFINHGGSNGDYGTTTTNGHTITSNLQSTTTHSTQYMQSITTSTTKLKMTRLVECMKNSATRVTRERVLNGWRSMLKKRQEVKNNR